VSQEEVRRLVREGLDAFGVGAQQRALRCWKRALELAPGDSEARDHLDAAAMAGITDDAEVALPSSAPATAETLLREAREMLHDEDPEAAFDLLQLAGQLAPGELEVESYLDLVRCQLLKQYRDRLGDPRARMRVVASAEKIARYQLAADAGFLLAQVDGATSIADLVSLAGTDAFHACRILDRLLSAGLVEVVA
jgi:tetratricopeptide (TPR) repeat protein